MMTVVRRFVYETHGRSLTRRERKGRKRSVYFTWKFHGEETERERDR